jgi:membrane-associated phospholipid phosphatase
MPAIDQSGHVVEQDGQYRLGRIISQVFHPTINGFVAYLLVGSAAPGIASVRSGLAWAATSILMIITPPSLYFYLRLFRGAYSDDDVSRRSERTGLYLVSVVSVLLGSYVLYLLGAPTPFLRLNAAALGVAIVAMMINFVWKISVHSASIGTLAMLATLFTQWLGPVLWVCAVVVGWARVRTGNHTPLQVLGGWSIAVAGVLLAFGIGRW